MGRNNDTNLWAPPVPGLDFDIEGPTADHLIDTSDIYGQTVYEHIHASKEEWTIVDKNEAIPYLPKRQDPLTVTIGIDNQKTEKLPTFGFIRLDENFKMKRGFVINAGMSVWGLDFVPKSTTCHNSQTQYLAIAGYRGSVEEHTGFDETQPTGTYKNAIQIWNLNLSTQVPSKSPFMDLCLLHDFGIIHELKWCPYGAYQEEAVSENEINKLGILSIVCGDGSIRTVVVPHPDYVRKNMCQVDLSETVYMKINQSRCHFQLNTLKPISMAWGGHKKLAIGYANGTLIIWNMFKALYDKSSCQAENSRRFIMMSCRPLDAAIRCIAWNGLRDPERILMGGYDGRLLLLDTNDPHVPLLINRARGIQPNCGWHGHSTMMLHFDNDFIGRGFGFFENGNSSVNRYGECPGVCWSIATSEHHGQASMSTAIGWVRSYNIYQVKLRKLHIYFHSVYKLHYNDETDSYRYLDGFVPQTVEESKKIPSYEQFGDTHMSIQKVVWNPNKPTCAFLASGGAAGLCRVEFEGRGPKWT